MTDGEGEKGASPGSPKVPRYLYLPIVISMAVLLGMGSVHSYYEIYPVPDCKFLKVYFQMFGSNRWLLLWGSICGVIFKAADTLHKRGRNRRQSGGNPEA